MRALRLGPHLALAAIFASATVCAQPATEAGAVATLKSVEGIILVSHPEAMAAGTRYQALRAGVRVLSTADSKAVIHYDKGCDVDLKENQRFTVRPLDECAALIASIESMGIGAAASGNKSGAGAGMADTGGVMILAVGDRIVDRKNRNVSPN